MAIERFSLEMVRLPMTGSPFSELDRIKTRNNCVLQSGFLVERHSSVSQAPIAEEDSVRRSVGRRRSYNCRSLV